MRRSSAWGQSSCRSRSRPSWRTSSSRTRPTSTRRSCVPWGEMAVEVSLPRLGQGMEAGTIVRWLKSEGDKVEKGEALYELDTDKVTQEVEAEASGVLLKIAISAGEVEVGRTIAVIGEQGEQVELAPSEPAGNGSAALEVSGDPEEEGSPARAREQDRERGRRASAALSDRVAEIRQ